MLEKIDGCVLLPGELYFIKSPIANIRFRKARMIRYNEEATGLFDAPTYGMCLMEVHLWTIYMYLAKNTKKRLEKNIMQHVWILF